MTAASGRPAIVVTHEGGVTFAAKVRSHRVVVDQPLQAGGSDSGPAPIELLAVSLGTCVAYYVQQFCHIRRLPYEGMRVEVETIGAANPHRIGRFTVRVVLPEEIPEHYTAMLHRVAQSCPAHNTLHAGADVEVRVESAIPVSV
jgi:uncharacterized OsmC-like protein